MKFSIQTEVQVIEIQAMCCDSQLHELQYTKFCCGNKTYDVYEKYCFQDQEILNLWENKCGGHKYDTREFICCRETLINRTHQDLRCCGSTSFNTNLQNCIDKRVVSKGYRWCPNCGGLVCGSGRGMFRYDTKNELCCNGTLYSVNSNVSCCHNTPFDKRFNICCGGQLRPKPELDTPVACCGTDPITDKNSLCCNGTLYSKNPNEYGCCGSKPYEFRKDRCCQDIVYKLSEREDCCKNRTFNKFDQYCYWEQEVLNITDNKCGGVVYNTRLFACCGGRLHPFYKGVDCCKSEAYNLSSQTCAYGHVVRKHFSWCKASGEYDPEQYECCEGRLNSKERKDESWRCCGSELIDYDDYDCCAGKKFNKRNENCCGDKMNMSFFTNK
ncbi:uncharacterized protein LOC111130829 [Crassostrea virginica]